MYGFSLTQPWATLVAVGAKRIETRSWKPNIHPWLAIHASKGFPRWAVELGLEEPFRTELVRRAGIRRLADLPRGSVIAVARLAHVGEIYRLPNEVRVKGIEWTVQGNELEFGDYTPGRYAWVLADVHALAEPIPCRGALSLWNVPDEVDREITRQIGRLDRYGQFQREGA